MEPVKVSNATSNCKSHSGLLIIGNVSLLKKKQELFIIDVVQERKERDIKSCTQTTSYFLLSDKREQPLLNNAFMSQFFALNHVFLF